MPSSFTRRLAMVLPIAGLMAASVPAAAQTTNLRVHTSNPGSSAFIFTTTMQRVAQRELPVRFNVTSGMTGTRSTLDAARGEVDLYISAPAINHFMASGSAMFADMPNAPELAENLRGLINFPLGPYHIITFADSGITALDDIRGRRVFAGPPGGAATTVALAIIRSTTGLVEDQDFTLARLDWTSGNQAFQDRQVDLAIIPTELPSGSIQQFALLSEIRMLGIPDDAIDVPPLSDMLAVPGRTVEEIPADIYGANQVNTESVMTVGSWVGIGVVNTMDDDLVYELTRVIFENLDDFHETAEWMQSVTPETALAEMNVPLHPGALRYYREIGVEIPDELLPPEAR
ncbi:MAG: TAXI family TRAP transporter solute-binding subunit [Pararhodobacter sp.]